MELKLLSVFSVLPLLASAKPSRGCGQAPKIITENTPPSTPLTLSSGGQNREYVASLPSSYNSSVPHRLILTLHGLKGHAGKVINGEAVYLPLYGLPNAIATSNTYKTDIPTIYIVPNGNYGTYEFRGKTHNDTGWWNADNSDVNFLRSLIETVQDDLCIDTSLVFSTGFSFGAAMSYILACNLGPEYLRGVAVLSGARDPDVIGSDCPALNATSTSTSTSGEQGVAIYIQHGTDDKYVPIFEAKRMRNRFLLTNGCDVAGTDVVPDPEAGSGARHTKTEYKGCLKDKPVTWVAFDGNHTSQPIDAGENETFTPREVWDFFGQFGRVE